MGGKSSRHHTNDRFVAALPPSHNFADSVIDSDTENTSSNVTTESSSTGKRGRKRVADVVKSPTKKRRISNPFVQPIGIVTAKRILRRTARSPRRDLKIDWNQDIGDGVTGHVYAAYLENNIQHDAATKVIDLREGVELEEMAYNEFDIVGTFSCKNIVKYFDIRLFEHIIFISMERCECSLFDIVCERSSPFTDVELRRLAAQVLHALSYLQLNGVVHADVKLDNILCNKYVDDCFSSETVAKLSDFGTARRVNYLTDSAMLPIGDGNGNNKKMIRKNRPIINSKNRSALLPAKKGGDAPLNYQGTPSFAPPELIEDLYNIIVKKQRHFKTEITYANDIWALGICLFECGTLAEPVTVECDPLGRILNIADVRQNIRAIPFGLLNSLSKDMVTFIERCLIVEPQRRPSAIWLETNSSWLDHLSGSDPASSSSTAAVH